MRSRRSHKAIANMPINCGSVASIPKAAIDSRMTSVSEWPRKVTPRAAQRGPHVLVTVDFAVVAHDEAAIGRHHRLMTGAATGRRSTGGDGQDATPASASIQTPSSSGPRWFRLRFIAAAIAPRACDPLPAPAATNPAIPHIEFAIATAVRVKSPRPLRCPSTPRVRPQLWPRHPAAREPCGREDRAESRRARGPACRHKFRDSRKMRLPECGPCRRS